MVLNMTIILKIASKYGTTDRNNPKISVMMIVISSIPLCHLSIFFWGGEGVLLINFINSTTIAFE